jgi:hypothetical protein
MPTINKVFTLEVTVEKFLESCSLTELREIDMLLDKYIDQATGRTIKVPPVPSLLYKPYDEITVSVDIEKKGDKISLEFSSDCGKFGTDEPIAGFLLTPKKLLNCIRKSELITDDELD